MWFEIPGAGSQFEIPDDWWTFVGMGEFSPSPGGYFPYSTAPGNEETVVEPLTDIEPPLRDAGIPPFKKYKLVPVLFSFMSPECALPPVEVIAATHESRYRYRVRNGYHRFYASVAAGYTNLPVLVRSPFNLGN